MACESEETLNLVKETVSTVQSGELWIGANLQVRHLQDLPDTPTIKINVPKSDLERRQNGAWTSYV